MRQPGNPVINPLEDILDDQSLMTWKEFHEPERPKILDEKYPPTGDRFENLDDEIEGIPTYQISILLEKIIRDPDPAILAAMRDALIMALMTYDHDEINEVDELFDSRKKTNSEFYEREVKTYQKYLENKNSEASKIKEEVKKFLDEISAYDPEEYSEDKVSLIIELVKVLDSNIEFDNDLYSKEGFRTLLDKFHKSNPYSLLDKPDEDLYHTLGMIRIRFDKRQLECGVVLSFQDSIMRDFLDCMGFKK